MRQAVVSLGPELLAEQGFRLEVFREAGVVDTEILSCDGPRGVLRVQVEERLDADRLEEMDAIQWWEQVATDGPPYVYVVEAGRTGDTVERTSEEGPFPRCEQVQVTDRGLTLTWAGSQDRLRRELAGLQSAHDTVSLEQLRAYRTQDAPLDALTDRQREVLEVAFERGYFDVPRTASAAEVAAVLDLDDSTVAEHLQRAERNLLGALLEQTR